ncbi:hypothetical protein HK102_000554 [Quaeritorhiza haematococci]|nr:hypothetical protein HK102_000554 [Quaeritorhiza haematococci]
MADPANATTVTPNVNVPDISGQLPHSRKLIIPLLVAAAILTLVTPILFFGGLTWLIRNIFPVPSLHPGKSRFQNGHNNSSRSMEEVQKTSRPAWGFTPVNAGLLVQYISYGVVMILMTIMFWIGGLGLEGGYADDPAASMVEFQYWRLKVVRAYIPFLFVRRSLGYRILIFTGVALWIATFILFILWRSSVLKSVSEEAHRTVVIATFALLLTFPLYSSLVTVLAGVFLFVDFTPGIMTIINAIIAVIAFCVPLVAILIIGQCFNDIRHLVNNIVPPAAVVAAASETFPGAVGTLGSMRGTGRGRAGGLGSGSGGQTAIQIMGELDARLRRSDEIDVVAVDVRDGNAIEWESQKWNKVER